MMRHHIHFLLPELHFQVSHVFPGRHIWQTGDLSLQHTIEPNSCKRYDPSSGSRKFLRRGRVARHTCSGFHINTLNLSARSLFGFTYGLNDTGISSAENRLFFLNDGINSSCLIGIKVYCRSILCTRIGLEWLTHGKSQYTSK